MSRIFGVQNSSINELCLKSSVRKKLNILLELVYRLQKSVDSTFLGKINELGDPILTKFHRFDRLANPPFRIKNANLGVEVSGKLGDNFLYCVIQDNHSKTQKLIEATLQNVG